MSYIPFARHSKADGDTRGYSGERLLNYFLRPSDGIAQGILIGRSGLEAVASVGAPVRGMIALAGLLYAVAGGKLWKVVGSTATEVGTVTDGPVSLASSGTQIAIVTGGKYYICDGTATAEYATGAVDAPQGVAYQDGYFIVIGDSAGRGDGVTVSALDNGTTFDGLDFAFAENAPDALTGIISDHGRLWLLGSRTVEVWYNSGDPDFPFSRYAGEMKERGCLDGQTVAKEDNSVFWVGEDRVVYRSGGTIPEVISTREVEEILSAATVEGAFTFTDRGHKFYAIRLVGRPTLCLDIITGLWSERSTGVADGAWIATAAATAGGALYFGTATGKICTASGGIFSDDGEPVKAEAVSVPMSTKFPAQAIGRVTAAVNTGTVDADGQIMLQTTQDGRRWGREKWRSLGSLGSYEKTPYWIGLGSFYPRFQVRVRITDPVKRDIYGVMYE